MPLSPTVQKAWQRVNMSLCLTFVALYLGALFDGMDASLFSAALPTALPDLLGTRDEIEISRIGSWITVIFLLGWTSGGIVFGWLGDRFGRIRVLTFSILLYALFTGLCGTAQSWVELACYRFMAALGVGGELILGSTFLNEAWPERSRTRAVGFLTTAYQAGAGLVGVSVLLLHHYDWRALFYLGALPVVLIVLIRSQVKESERWVESRKLVTQGALQAGIQAVQELFTRHLKHLLAASTFVGANSVAYWACLFWIPAWIYQLIPDHKPITELSLALSLQGTCTVIGCIVAGYSVDRLGRKTTICIGLLGFFLSILGLFGLNTVFSPIIYPFIGAAGFYNGLTIGVCYILVPELFPTSLRATSMGLCFNLGRFMAVVGTLLSAQLIEYFGGSYAEAVMMISTILLAGLLSAAFVPETKEFGLQR